MKCRIVIVTEYNESSIDPLNGMLDEFLKDIEVIGHALVSREVTAPASEVDTLPTEESLPQPKPGETETRRAERRGRAAKPKRAAKKKPTKRATKRRKPKAK